jgi:hypothetical protein
MSEFDNFVKHTLQVKYYARYTDDFVIVSHDKEYLSQLLPLLKKFLNEKLLLNLHPNKISIRKYANGIDFLGYIILPHCRLIRKRTWKRMQRKFKIKIKAYKQDKVSKESIESSLQSYLGVLSHADSNDLETILKNELMF